MQHIVSRGRRRHVGFVQQVIQPGKDPIRFVQPRAQHYSATALQTPHEMFDAHSSLTEEDVAQHQQGVSQAKPHQPQAEGPKSAAQKGTADMVTPGRPGKKKAKKPKKPKKKKPRKSKKKVRFVENLPDYLKPLKLF